MNAVNLPDPRRIQFIAANYSRLQGLRSLPIGLLVFFVTLWANQQRGPAPRPVLVPVLIAAAGLGLYGLIDMYYKRVFGQVVSPRGHLDWILGIAGAVAGLVAFAIDITWEPPVSMIGLCLAAAVLADYLTLVQINRIWYLSFAPVFALLIALVSILPALGLDGWWRALGIKTGVLGVLLVSGLILIVSSLASHFYFIHVLAQEARYGRSV